MERRSQPPRGPVQPDDVRNYGAGSLMGQVINALKTGWNHAVALKSGLAVTGATTTGALVATQPATGTTAAKIVGIAGSTVNLLEVDASAIANAVKWVVDKNGHLASSQAAVPTGVLGTGAGTGAGTAPVLTITGTDHDGFIQVVTGTQVPVAGATIVTVTFKTAMVAAPNSIIITNASGATQGLARAQDPLAPSNAFNAALWNLVAGTTALPVSSTLIWWYSIR